MTSLLTRLESLTGPSRDVSDELLLSWGWERGWDYPRPWPYDGVLVWTSPCGKEYHGGRQPHPTASIDDALLGVPEGWFWTLTQGGIAEVRERWETVAPTFNATSRNNPAIALCIAIVKARGGV